MKRRSLLLLSLLFLLAAAVFLFFSIRFSDSGFALLRGFFAPVRTSTSWSILEEIREMEELETAAYDMKVVFPFDFTRGEEVDWAALKIEYDWSPARFLAKADPAAHPGGILPPLWKHAELYALCRSTGIDPGRPDRRFLVMSVSVHAGIDLESWLAGFEAGEPEDEVRGISVEIGEDGYRTLSLMDPPVEVTSFIIEDRDAAAEGFPDVPVSPQEWRNLVVRLEPALREMALGGGLPERAQEEGRAFLTEIFKAAGYDDVRFIDG